MLLGAAVALRIFGLRYLLGTSAFWSWPVGDAAMMLTGWEYYVHEPWHWPLVHTYATNGPRGANLLYYDAIPLVAFVGKIVRGVIGGTWHPYGVWHFTEYVLQAVFAGVLARRVGIRGMLGGLGVAMLAVSSQAFLLRFFHEGLNSHFVLLWALDAYLRTGEPRRPRWLGLEWAACSSCAVLIHPYLGAMTAAIAVAAAVRLGSRRPENAAVVFGLAVPLLLVVMFAFGYFPSSLPPVSGLYGLSSLNLVSLAVPFYSRMAPSLRWTVFQDATGMQWDGAGFLGVGVWLLVLASIAGAWRSALALVARHKAFAAALLALALYAVSNRFYVGRTLVWSYDVPEALEPSFDALRATGRLFWPVTYAVLVAASCIVARRFGPKGVAAVALVGVVQLADASAAWPVMTTSVAAPWKRELDWPAWSREVRGVSRVNIFPSYGCWWPLGASDRVLQEQRELEYLAASNGMHTNAGRTARALEDCGLQHAQGTNAAQGELQEGELYVFFAPAYSRETLAMKVDARCIDLADAVVCRRTP